MAIMLPRRAPASMWVLVMHFVFFQSMTAAFSPPITASVSATNPSIDNNDEQHQRQQVEGLVATKLERIATEYQTHIRKIRATMEMQIDLSVKVERCFVNNLNASGGSLLSASLSQKQSVMEECLNANSQVVQQLLRVDDVETSPVFQKIQFVQSTPKEANNDADDDDPLQMGNGGVQSSTKETEGYDTAQQVISHTARDWTAGAAPCRDETHGWIVRAIAEHCSRRSAQLRVLVPGAGLGRLAYDIATCRQLHDVEVEANDSSITMAIAARSVLEMLEHPQHPAEQRRIYPFVSDPQINEIDSIKRYEMELFPDQEALESFRRSSTTPNLSFTVGDFVSTYSQDICQSQYDAIATCFFIDTATNIYEYLFIMKHLLNENNSSIWVNCGPVQWHPCALLRPTVHELRDLLEAAGFELLTWEVATTTVPYRHPDDWNVGEQARYTKSDAYRPLRFVARLKEDTEETENLSGRIQYTGYLNEVANGLREFKKRR
ncbi:hypothetical protein ACHAXR_007539 [Thalassiosira sp. AJA248-18]